MDNSSNEKKIDELFDNLKKGLKDIYKDSKKYLDFLQTNSKWKRYSLNNKIYLWMQCGKRGYEGNYINTFQGWKKLGYSVNKGEKAMEILMPGFNKYFKNENDKWISLKKATGEQLAKVKAHELQTKEVISSFFIKKAMFDIRQTNCPEEEYENKMLEKVMPKSLEESQDKKIDFLFFKLKNHIIEIEKLPVNHKELEEDLKGYVNKNEIVLNERNSNLQNLKTLIHEYTHYKLHINHENDLKRYEEEIEAESVAYIVCSAYDIDTSDYSFKYINFYGQENTEEELFNSFEQITFTANTIKDVLDAELSMENINSLTSGDIVYANLQYSDSNEEAKRLLFILDKNGEKYEAFNISSEENPYITNVKLEKDDSNHLNENSQVKMNVKYLISKTDIVKKIGKVKEEQLPQFIKCANLFESKKLTNDFISKPAQKIENQISMTNELSLGGVKNA